MMMVLGRTFTLATTKGHVIHFPKGKPVNVPQICIADAVGIGATPADGSEVDLIGEEKKTYDGPSDPVAREKDLLAACALIEEQNARADFTAAGVPSTDALTRVAGFAVGAAERNQVWQVYQNQKASASE